jgi:hypothetical protein
MQRLEDYNHQNHRDERVEIRDAEPALRYRESPSGLVIRHRSVLKYLKTLADGVVRI